MFDEQVVSLNAPGGDRQKRKHQVQAVHVIGVALLDFSKEPAQENPPVGCHFDVGIPEPHLDNGPHCRRQAIFDGRGDMGIHLPGNVQPLQVMGLDKVGQPDADQRPVVRHADPRMDRPCHQAVMQLLFIRCGNSGGFYQRLQFNLVGLVRIKNQVQQAVALAVRIVGQKGGQPAGFRGKEGRFNVVEGGNGEAPPIFKHFGGPGHQHCLPVIQRLSHGPIISAL